MISTDGFRKGVALWGVSLFAIVLFACGGGGGGGGSGPGPSATPRTPPRTAPFGSTPTEPPPPETNTPTASPTAVQAGGSLLQAIRSAAPGSTIVVSAGTYAAFELKPSDMQGPITLMADQTGLMSEGGMAPATIDAREQKAAAITLNGVSDLIIDGFTLRGGSASGIRVVNGAGITLRNCIVKNNGGDSDAVRFESSQDALVFNNLIYNNAGGGIGVVGTINLSVVNNTVYKNLNSGLFVGDSLSPSSNILVRNNIFNLNAPKGISVHTSTTGYDGDYNLNTDGYAANTPIGANDFNANPLFNLPGDDSGFHVLPPFDDCSGGSPVVDAGDPNTDSGLVQMLLARTVQTDGRLDCVGFGCCPDRDGEVDLGFHYLGLQAFFTPTVPPRPTRTRPPTTSSPVPSGPTRTPTHTLGLGVFTPTPTNTSTSTSGPGGRPTRTWTPTRVPHG